MTEIQIKNLIKEYEKESSVHSKFIAGSDRWEL